MRIACLQFDPQVDDVDNNLNRADDILGQANPDDLDRLDLLVLPELAFAGYNFRSLQHIAPCFEGAGSGITSAWAQATALKHDTTVVVGYPEKVDVSARWPASPEYYNSALVVNGDGDLVANYRKSFLYYTDETWALEGPDGFFKGEISGLGNVALGICTDLNPYKLEAPWDAFEFGFHILKAQANLVIMTMAWQTHQDPAVFNQAPQEPDLETLVYWVQRLEPLIRADKEEEVIVVFCNRTGAEEEATYTGTSAVLGVIRGDVFVYGVLGRGVNQLLIVDTDQPPRSKLTDADAAEVDSQVPERIALDTTMDHKAKQRVSDDLLSPANEVCQCHPADSALGHGLENPRNPTSPRLPWLAQPREPGGTPTDSRSPTRLQIPTRPAAVEEYTAIDSAITDDIISTPALPAGPSFARRPLRSHVATPRSPWRFPGGKAASPYPWNHHDGSRSAVFGGGATMTPITPFDEDGWSSTPIDPKGPPQWFWRHEPTLAALKESIVEEEEEEEEEEEKEEVQKPPPPAQVQRAPDREQEPPSVDGRNDSGVDEVSVAQSEREETASGEASEEESNGVPLGNDWADLAQVLEGLRARPGSAFDFRSSRREDRPDSPKSRNLSRSASPFHLFQPSELSYGERETAAWGSVDSDLPARVDIEGHDLSPGTLEQPGSQTGQRTVQSRNNSFDSATQDRSTARVARRRESRLRHALFFPDEADHELGPGYRPDRRHHQPNDLRPQSISSLQQPPPQRTAKNHPPSGTRQQHQPASTRNATKEWGRSDYYYYSDDEDKNPPPTTHSKNPHTTTTTTTEYNNTHSAPTLNIALGTPSPVAADDGHAHTHTQTLPLLVETTTPTITATPSLCSATSAASTATSVSSPLADHHHLPHVDKTKYLRDGEQFGGGGRGGDDDDDGFGGDYWENEYGAGAGAGEMRYQYLYQYQDHKQKQREDRLGREVGKGQVEAEAEAVLRRGFGDGKRDGNGNVWCVD
ncbi:hypothetical protein N658DRAFT_138846 [Parathielavia hyrcaniae]|uniref:CN hydrolase domain-containing protein n=1 Tax=Parathielavia hyrcaniae TaxID=113614 RepID=A0AAN6PY37_9PEZI|nr:hypothetical protein N658DRAFT_138846 [Parathielavia hyrcaniae]